MSEKRQKSAVSWCRTTGPRDILGTLTVVPLFTILARFKFNNWLICKVQKFGDFG